MKEKSPRKTATFFRRYRRFWTLTIWRREVIEDKSLSGRIMAFIRICSLTVSGFLRNNIAVRAAALSYSSLIALGPLVAIFVMISGFVLQNRGGEELAAQKLTELIKYIAPTVEQFEQVDIPLLQDTPAAVKPQPETAPPADDAGLAQPVAAEAPAAGDSDMAVNPRIIRLIEDMIESAQSGTVGVVGLLILIAIGIQLLTSIEKTLNDIWGVRKGRTMVNRVIYYWAFISLGSVLFFSAVTLLTTATLVNQLDALGRFPGGETLKLVLISVTPLLSFLLIVGLLTAFYRFFPNTTVKPGAAASGAFMAALLLLLNNNLSFVYVGAVVRNGSLFGSVGIVPVLMLGMYFFWMFVLIGGQISYACQNANTLANKQAWNNISTRTREMLGLAAFLLVCRRFQSCDEPYSLNELTALTHAPGDILNECLSDLCDAGLLLSVAEEDRQDESSEHRYAPAKPLEGISLGHFKDAFETLGNNDGIELLHNIDPVIDHYRSRYGAFGNDEVPDLSLNDALKRFPSASGTPAG